MMAGTDVDVIVVGSGAAGLVAAVAAARAGRRVLVLERTAHLGGTSALSGGLFYLPGSHLAVAAGVAGERSEHLRYFRSIAKKPVDEALLGAFLDAAPAVARLLDGAGVPLRLTGLVDYVRDAPGAATGKVLGTEQLPLEKIRAAVGLVRPSLLPPVVPDDAPWTGGRSLVGWLVGACIDGGVKFRIGTRARSLLHAAGVVTGVVAETADGSRTQVTATDGVVLACGGFEFNHELLERFGAGALEASWSCPGNEGDGLLMAEEVGAELGGLGEVQWYPLVRWGDHDLDGTPLFRDAGPVRCLPGTLIVDATGNRFTNEGQQFTELGRALSALPDGRRPAWLIFDQQFVDTYGDSALGGTGVDEWTNHTASSIAELAARITVPAEALTASVERFNEAAASGRDVEFGRGDSQFDREWGDPSRPGAAACLGALQAAPFYATRVYVGSSGTTGGPVVDVHGRVLSSSGAVIHGLFAAGNVTPAIFGDTSPGSGATLGPGMAFGYLAGITAAAQRSPAD